MGMPTHYSAVTSRASEAAEKAADSWAQGMRKLTGLVPALPQIDLVPAVERYFDLVQRAVDMNRDVTVRWVQAAGTLTGAVREQAETAGQVVRERAESAGDAVRERAESFDQAAARLAEQAEQAERELAREARRLEREQAKQAHQQAREPYEGLSKAELSNQLARRGLPKTGNINELIERLVEADGK